jgi:hypothetical protein
MAAQKADLETTTRIVGFKYTTNPAYAANGVDHFSNSAVRVKFVLGSGEAGAGMQYRS